MTPKEAMQWLLFGALLVAVLFGGCEGCSMWNEHKKEMAAEKAAKATARTAAPAVTAPAPVPAPVTPAVASAPATPAPAAAPATPAVDNSAQQLSDWLHKSGATAEDRIGKIKWAIGRIAPNNTDAIVRAMIPGLLDGSTTAGGETVSVVIKTKFRDSRIKPLATELLIGNLSLVSTPDLRKACLEALAGMGPGVYPKLIRKAGVCNTPEITEEIGLLFKEFGARGCPTRTDVEAALTAETRNEDARISSFADDMLRAIK